MSTDEQQYNDICAIHIRYIDYRFNVATQIKHIVNFNDYIVRFYNLNKDYYKKLAEKYNIDLTK